MNSELLRFLKKSISDFGGEFEDNRFVMQFIPIILVLLFSLYARRFIEVGNSVLGKLFAVVLIMFYTKLNILYGVFACVITILFYQLTEGSLIDGTIVEGMKGKKGKKYNKKPVVTPTVLTVTPAVAAATPAVAAATPAVAAAKPAAATPAVITPAVAAAAVTATTTTSKPASSGQIPAPSEEDKDIEDGTNFPDDTAEGFESYQSLYPVINIEDFNAAKEEFIKEKCKNGVVMYKDMPVKFEMVDHIFSEINFTTKTKCNPCDRTCAYSIVERKLATEEELGRPKNSNDVFEWIKQLF
jgi:hypothetical protein